MRCKRAVRSSAKWLCTMATALIFMVWAVSWVIGLEYEHDNTAEVVVNGDYRSLTHGDRPTASGPLYSVRWSIIDAAAAPRLASGYVRPGRTAAVVHLWIP